MRLKPLAIGLALAAVLLAVGVPASGSSAPHEARVSAADLLEKRTVSPTGKVVKSRTSLKKGKRYRLVLTGTVTTTLAGPDGTINSRFDALYCFATFGTSPLAHDPSTSCTTNVRRHGSFLLGQRTLGFPEQLNPRGFNTAYSPRHRYEVTFRAKRTGKLGFVFRTNVAQRSGHYTVRLYRAAARKKPQPPHSCPAPRSSGTSEARAAASCHWVVNFRISQTGFPNASHPRPPSGLVTTETHGVGKIFFSAKPKPGRTSVGRAAGLVIHTDTYQSPINPFLFMDGETKLKPVTAKFTPRVRIADSLVLRGEVTSVAGVPYSPVESGGTIKPGDRAEIALRAEPPLHREDLMTLIIRCGNCLAPDAIVGPGDHVHQYRVSSRGKLRVEIDSAHPL